MKITSIRVDGFGTLADLEVRDLPPGLSVVHGANEAGKSTLLDFLRSVLFGFPDRRSRLAQRMPLRGGRHGGAIGLVDDLGRPYLLERHSDQREPSLTGPTGSLESPASLSRLLGGADAALFRSIFAFGLGELSAFDSLDSDGVRDVVFSAGVLGAGRAATNAASRLDQQRAALVRPRQDKAVANALRLRLEEADARLRAARRAAASYPDRLAEHEQLVGGLAGARAEVERLRRRTAEIERLLALWPTHRTCLEASKSLANLQSGGDADVAALEHAKEIAWLGESRTGHVEREGKLAELTVAVDTANAELDGLALRLGGAALSPLPLEVRDRTERLRRSVPDALGMLRAADEGVRRAEERLREANGTLASLFEEADKAPLLTQRLADVRRLGEAEARLERLRERERQRRTEEELRTRAHGRSDGSDRASGLVLGIASLLAFALGGISIADTHKHGTSALALGAGAVVLGVLVSIVAIRLATARRRHKDVVSEAIDPELESTAREAERLRRELGYPLDGFIAFDEEARGISERLERRRRYDDASAQIDRANAELVTTREQRNRAARELSSIDEAAGKEALALGLPAGLSLDGLCDALSDLERAAELRSRIARVTRAADAIAPAIGEFHSTLQKVEAAIGLEPDAEGDLTRRIRALESSLREASDRAADRARLEEQLARAERTLAEGFGLGQDADRLRHELAGGLLAEWTIEHDSLAAQLAEADRALEAELGRARDAERELEALRASADVAEAAAERDAIHSELSSVLERWLVLGAARSLLERSLSRYEQESQPEVIARATALFGEVTDGRYVSLVAREDEDGRRRRIDAISASGERIDSGELSRGTAEQLYLCLRLAFATTFAERAIALPIVVDDVLVNFDPTRASAVARVLAGVSAEHQVLAFTCHPHVVELFAEAAGDCRVVEL